MVRIHLGPPGRRAISGRLAWGDETAGDVAQLGERWLCKPEVAGSIPVISTRKARISA